MADTNTNQPHYIGFKSIPIRSIQNRQIVPILAANN